MTMRIFILTIGVALALMGQTASIPGASAGTAAGATSAAPTAVVGCGGCKMESWYRQEGTRLVEVVELTGATSKPFVGSFRLQPWAKHAAAALAREFRRKCAEWRAQHMTAGYCKDEAFLNGVYDGPVFVGFAGAAIVKSTGKAVALRGPNKPACRVADGVLACSGLRLTASSPLRLVVNVACRWGRAGIVNTIVPGCYYYGQDAPRGEAPVDAYRFDSTEDPGLKHVGKVASDFDLTGRYDVAARKVTLVMSYRSDVVLDRFRVWFSDVGPTFDCATRSSGKARGWCATGRGNEVREAHLRWGERLEVVFDVKRSDVPRVGGETVSGTITATLKLPWARYPVEVDREFVVP
jgi:hypothetical protein